jgi:octaprenyl-diphosphate synthase
MSESATELSLMHVPAGGGYERGARAGGEVAPERAPAVGAGAPAAMDTAVELVADDLRATEVELERLLQSTITVIPKVGGHLAFAGGKRFRPLVALLAARAAGFTAQSRITVAAVGELLHTATLLHDDVIDEGEYRRGRPAPRMAYGNGLAVLVGDFCLARALQAMAQTGELDAVTTMADAVTRMAEGEVAQLHAAGDGALDRERYYLVIDRKTAALIAWCASVAGLVGPARAAALGRYGLELGYAFQIADDVIDYAHGVDVAGKARGQDLREGKLTLPLLLACELDPSLRDAVRAAVRAKPPMDAALARDIVERVVHGGGLAEARAIAERHVAAAIDALAPLPPSPARDALIAIAHHVVHRSA